ncbi:MAG: lipoprotein-releasing system ATP-binding protein [Rickettsiales bacterium]|jgi:lipoprotein-releasing system ATP-binding protein
MSNNLVLKNINKSFLSGKQTINVIINANLSIEKGESVALVGNSGAGKTTFLQIAGLLDNPDSGNILIRNIDASKADDNTRTNLRKNHIGFIYQSHHLLPEFSALENVAMPLLIKGTPKKSALKQAAEILDQIGLKDRLTHLPSELSGGQQQRVAVARAIVGKPSLLLADEPTGNLDSANADNVFDLIKKLSKQHQISSLIVTHNLDLARKLDRMVEIKDGILI